MERDALHTYDIVKVKVGRKESYTGEMYHDARRVDGARCKEQFCEIGAEIEKGKDRR
jgi:hypothetical protein